MVGFGFPEALTDGFLTLQAEAVGTAAPRGFAPGSRAEPSHKDLHRLNVLATYRSLEKGP
jgi:hypothetical protein